MKSFFEKNAQPLFYAGWFLLGLVQALFTELQDDEAYYWVYAHYLDWGYFDHPPMIAVLIKAGTALFSGALGVRFFPLVLNTLTLLLTESLLKDKNRLLFYAIALSAAVLQLIGYWAVPDVPLLFFTAFFFWCYQKWMRQTTLSYTLLFAVACALLMYTKYHGALIILFTVLSNLSLFRRWQLYAAGLVALLLFVPHLWWQYGHDWISFRYHLFESNVNRYKFSYTTEYVLGQLLIAGPVAGVILLWSTFGYRTQNLTERALKATAIGIFSFFFLSSFKGKVEANWTAPAIIPMLVLTHAYLQQHPKWKAWLCRLLPVSIVLVLFARLIMIADILPVKPVVQRFHAWEGWPQKAAALTQDHPVVFINSYQRASKYWFYSGRPAYSLSSHRERRSNYNFWPVEDSLLGRPVYIMDIYNIERFQDSVKARLWTVGLSYDSSFQSFAKVLFKPAVPSYTIASHKMLPLNLQVSISPYYKTYLQQHPQTDQPLVIGVFQAREWVKDITPPLTLQQAVKNPGLELQVPPQLPKGTYFLRVAAGTSAGVFTHNSDKINVTVQ